MSLFSQRFDKKIRVTRHAQQQMHVREVTEEQLFDIIETGEIKKKDTKRLWIYKNYPEREDNLVCTAVVLEEEVVVKTVMIHWQLRSEACESATTQKKISSLLN